MIEVNEGHGVYYISDVQDELIDNHEIAKVLDALHREGRYIFEDGASYRLIR